MEIAIKVLRQAGYHSHAVFLAEKHMHHEWYLKIQLEDLKVDKAPVQASVRDVFRLSFNVLTELPFPEVCVCLLPDPKIH